MYMQLFANEHNVYMKWRHTTMDTQKNVYICTTQMYMPLLRPYNQYVCLDCSRLPKGQNIFSTLDNDCNIIQTVCIRFWEVLFVDSELTENSHLQNWPAILM